MNRYMRTVGASALILLAIVAVRAANASAASFKYSEIGSLVGVQTGNQVFTTSGGSLNCTKAATSGTDTSLDFSAQKYTVKYSGCKAFGFASVSVSPAEYDLHADGEVDLLNAFKINVPLGGCSVTVGPHSGLGSVSYVNRSGELEIQLGVGGIPYTSTGSVCGPGGGHGTLTGNSLIELAGGGTIEYVP